MSLLKLANRLILANSDHWIDPESRRRVAIPCGDEQMEAWVIESVESPELFCLKFPGTGGRAERAGPHPAKFLSPDRFETWTINPPGYGVDNGTACVSKMPTVCHAAWDAISQKANGRPIVVTGNSLGCLYALNVAANFPVAALTLRNPAPVHQLIRGRYSWWNLGLAGLVARQVPSNMNAVSNGKKCSAACLMITSDSDRVVPPKYQDMVADAYNGPLIRFVLQDADHATSVPEEQLADYKVALQQWQQLIS